MALASKTPTTPNKARGTATSAQGKKDQRARNKAAGIGSRSGSSGQALLVKDLPKFAWEDVEDEVTHVCDIAAKISHSQVGASGFLVSTLNSPLEYAHDLLDAHIKARDGLCYIRIYHVSLESYLAAGKPTALTAQEEADIDLVDQWLDVAGGD
jgi:hypothetical protein